MSQPNQPSLAPETKPATEPLAKSTMSKTKATPRKTKQAPISLDPRDVVFYTASNACRLLGLPAAPVAPVALDAAEASLRYALKAVTGQRAGQYGAAERNLKRIAKLQRALQEVMTDCGPEAQQLLVDSGAKAALDLAMVKIARICQSPGHADSWADLAGYGAIGYRAVYEHLVTTDKAAAARSIGPLALT